MKTVIKFLFGVLVLIYNTPVFAILMLISIWEWDSKYWVYYGNKITEGLNTLFNEE